MSQSDSETEGSGDRILACPVCGAAMAVETVQLVKIDVCENHGMWLDQGELKLIQVRGFAKGSRQRQSRLKEAKRRGRLQGWLSGLASLNFD